MGNFYEIKEVEEFPTVGNNFSIYIRKNSKGIFEMKYYEDGEWKDYKVADETPKPSEYVRFEMRLNNCWSRSQAGLLPLEFYDETVTWQMVHDLIYSGAQVALAVDLYSDEGTTKEGSADYLSQRPLDYEGSLNFAAERPVVASWFGNYAITLPTLYWAHDGVMRTNGVLYKLALES